MKLKYCRDSYIFAVCVPRFQIQEANWKSLCLHTTVNSQSYLQSCTLHWHSRCSLQVCLYEPSGNWGKKVLPITVLFWNWQWNCLNGSDFRLLHICHLGSVAVDHLAYTMRWQPCWWAFRQEGCYLLPFSAKVMENDNTKEEPNSTVLFLIFHEMWVQFPQDWR